jgi:thioredoxin-like negative regulator of GroEL
MVLQNSGKGPVTMYCWPSNAGPCMMLLPRLVKLAVAYSGRFLLTLLNCDQYKLFSKDQGVISIPTVQVYVRDDAVALYQLAACHLVRDDYDTALETFSRLLECSNYSMKAKSHRCMLAIFAILGPTDPVTRRRRLKIMSVRH